MKAVPSYVELHGRDPTGLIFQEHMSDEASGPESKQEESQQQWKMRMAEALGMKEPNVEAIAKLKFLEVIKPGWRSKEV
jgi:hypothetical protein